MRTCTNFCLCASKNVSRCLIVEQYESRTFTPRLTVKHQSGELVFWWAEISAWLSIMMICSGMPYLSCSKPHSSGGAWPCAACKSCVVSVSVYTSVWTLARTLVGHAGDLHFSNIEMSDDRAGSNYVCIVQNTELRSQMQGDDQIIEPIGLSGTASLHDSACPTYRYRHGDRHKLAASRPLLFWPHQLLGYFAARTI